jgi:8-oxo-dGTP diphosphatase
MNRVTAAVIEKDGLVLIAKRKKGKKLGEKWEFPGGKLEPGEEPRDCLKRELAEELGIEADVGDLLCSAVYEHPDFSFELMVFRVPAFRGSPVLREHEELRWVRREEVSQYDLADSDRIAVGRLGWDAGRG